MIWPAMVRAGKVGVGSGSGRSNSVLVPMTTYESPDARLMRVPEIVIAGPPGVRVWSEMRYRPRELAVMI